MDPGNGQIIDWGSSDHLESLLAGGGLIYQNTPLQRRLTSTGKAPLSSPGPSEPAWLRNLLQSATQLLLS